MIRGMGDLEGPQADRGPGARVAAAALAAMVMALAACGSPHKSAGTAVPPVTTSSPAPTSTTVPEVILPTSPSVAGPPTPSTSRPTPASSSTVAPPGPSVAPLADQQAALKRVVAAYPPRSFATSAILHNGALSFVAVAHDVTSLTSVINLYAYEGTEFMNVITLGAEQSLDPVAPTTIQSASITGAALPDFLVLLVAGDHRNGVLVSIAGGVWHLVGTAERTGPAASNELVQPRVVGNQLIQSVNDCAPDCAHGTYAVTTYRFDPGLGKLVAVGPTVQSPTP